MDTLSEQTPLLSNNEVISDVHNSTYEYTWKATKACINTLVHALIAVTVFVTSCFAFNSFPLTPFQWHVGLSVIGYQLLIAHGILALASYNSWSGTLTRKHRMRSHWVLQLVGSILAIVGSAIMMKQKTVNFNTIHGKLALAALVFTCVSLINGLVSFYKFGVGRLLTKQVFKISHLLIGTLAFTLSSVCLAFGFAKNSFRRWSSEEFSYVMIAITCTYTLIIIIKPCRLIWKKLFCAILNKNC